MAENILINGTTYNGVESVELNTTEGKKVLFFQGQPVSVVQGTGSDETAVMSQAAVTNALNKLSNEIVDNSLPAYYEENGYLSTRIAAVRGLMDEAGADGIAFVMFSDSHMELAGGGVNGGNSGKIAYKILNECQIPFALHFGDAGSNSPQETEELCVESLEAFNTMVKPLEGRLFQILGNHDGAWGLPADIDGDGTADASTETYPYNMPRAKTFNRTLQKNRLSPRIVTSPDGGYYYIDDAGSRTRFLMLNTNDKPYVTNANGTMKTEGNTMKGTMMRQAQIDWIIESLHSIPDGWDVIACSHHPLHQNTVTVGVYVRNIFRAFRDKTTYAATYDGEYSEGGGAAYTNLADPTSSDWWTDARMNSSGAKSAETGTITTNIISGLKKNDVVRIQGINVTNHYWATHAITNNNWAYAKYTNQESAGRVATTSVTASYAEFTMTTDNFDQMRFSGIPNGNVSDIIITVNEEIVESEGTSIDGLNINVNFSENKGGDFIALFDGHAHNDYHYTADSFLVDMVSIACDGRVSNCAYMEDETYQNRALGTIYEQVVDAVVINKATRTIKTVRFGAGADREIGY